MPLYIITILSLKVVVLYTSQMRICPKYCDKIGSHQWTVLLRVQHPHSLHPICNSFYPLSFRRVYFPMPRLLCAASLLSVLVIRTAPVPISFLISVLFLIDAPTT
jgi:hypothetical protein